MAVLLLSQLFLAGDAERGRRAISGLLLLKLKGRGVKGSQNRVFFPPELSEEPRNSFTNYPSLCQRRCTPDSSLWAGERLSLRLWARPLQTKTQVPLRGDPSCHLANNEKDVPHG